MTFIRNRITLSIKYFQQSHGGLLPQKIAMNPETYENLKAEVEEDDENFENAIPHGRFLQPIGYEEIEVILAWMKVFWCEHLLSNSDNFDGI